MLDECKAVFIAMITHSQEAQCLQKPEISLGSFAGGSYCSAKALKSSQAGQAQACLQAAHTALLA
jgi:hypothetical protein